MDPSDTRHAWAALEGTFDRPVLQAHGRDLYLDTVAGVAVIDLCFSLVCVEMVACYGMSAGAHLFDTCVGIGGILANMPGAKRITRPEVKLLVCGQTRAKDANVRQAIIDRFGGPSAIRKGGPLYKVSGDTWAAIAVALAAMHPEAKFYVPAHERPTRSSDA